MKMKTTYKNLMAISAMVAITLGFNACSDTGHFKDAQNKISITNCSSGVTIPDDYVSMLSGDTLVQEATGTVVTTYHDINGTKKVCTDSGIAYLIRQ